MNVLALIASPRINGYSTQLNELFCSALARQGSLIDTVRLYDRSIAPCTACGHCREHPTCSIDDDMTDLYRMIIQADIISVSSPVYFSSLPGILKTVIDRCQPFWEKPMGGMLNRDAVGVFLSSAGSVRYPTMFVSSTIILQHFFKTIRAAYREDHGIMIDNTDSQKPISDMVKAQVESLASSCAEVRG